MRVCHLWCCKCIVRCVRSMNVRVWAWVRCVRVDRLPKWLPFVEIDDGVSLHGVSMQDKCLQHQIQYRVHTTVSAVCDCTCLCSSYHVAFDANSKNMFCDNAASSGCVQTDQNRLKCMWRFSAHCDENRYRKDASKCYNLSMVEFLLIVLTRFFCCALFPGDVKQFWSFRDSRSRLCTGESCVARVSAQTLRTLIARLCRSECLRKSGWASSTLEATWHDLPSWHAIGIVSRRPISMREHFHALTRCKSVYHCCLEGVRAFSWRLRACARARATSRSPMEDFVFPRLPGWHAK
jgi:hypothetical protein